LPETLLGCVLERLERFPHAVFWESELRGWSTGEFEELKRERVLRFVQTDIDEVMYPCPTPAADCSERALLRVGRTLLAVCPCPAEEAPVELAEADVRRYDVDAPELARRFRAANDLSEAPAYFDDQFLVLGEVASQGGSSVVALAFLGGEARHLPALRQLPLALAPRQYRNYLVLCPTLELTPAELRELEAQRVTILRPKADDPLRLDLALPSSEVNPADAVRLMKRALAAWPKGRKPGAGQAFVHIIDHIPLPDYEAAAQLVDQLGIKYTRKRIYQTVSDGRVKYLDKTNCGFCWFSDRVSHETVGEIGGNRMRS
jgi:hypothetical protein